MGCAEIIALSEVRASKQWEVLRHQLHERFDQWLDTLEQQWPEPPSTLPEVTATVWNIRQQLTGSITETIVAHVHHREHDRQQAPARGVRGVALRAFVGRRHAGRTRAAGAAVFLLSLLPSGTLSLRR